MMNWQVQGKTIHHRCGYPLWVRVAHQFEGVGDGSVVSVEGRGDVLVEYRDLSQADGLVVWMCPECYGALPLWWDSGGRWVGPNEPSEGVVDESNVYDGVMMRSE